MFAQCRLSFQKENKSTRIHITMRRPNRPEIQRTVQGEPVQSQYCLV